MSPAIGADFNSGFDDNRIGGGGVGGGAGDSGDAVNANSKNTNNGYSFWHVRYYAGWFNVDTSDVASRIAFSSVPLSDKFFEKINHNPDLYGPTWISSTVVFMLAATGNFADWIDFASQHGMQSYAWTYDFTKMTFGATIVYGYASLIPFLVYLALRYAGARTSLVDLLCLYGYSLFIYVPASILCIPPSPVVQWIFVALAALASTAFQVRSLRFVLRRDQCNQRIGSLVISAAALLSVAFAVTLKLFLFQNANFANLIEITGGARPAETTTVAAATTTTTLLAVAATTAADSSAADVAATAEPDANAAVLALSPSEAIASLPQRSSGSGSDETDDALPTLLVPSSDSAPATDATTTAAN
jgi:hypothetical protein